MYIARHRETRKYWQKYGRWAEKTDQIYLTLRGLRQALEHNAIPEIYSHHHPDDPWPGRNTFGAGDEASKMYTTIIQAWWDRAIEFMRTAKDLSLEELAPFIEIIDLDALLNKRFDNS